MYISLLLLLFFFFFFTDTATTEIYTLSLHDALPIFTTDLCIENVHFRRTWHPAAAVGHRCITRGLSDIAAMGRDRKSTRLNSSHRCISYAVFCLKKKKQTIK